MSNTNAIARLLQPSLQELSDSLGVTQFPSDVLWYQTLGGLLVQGGKVSVPGAGSLLISYNAGFPTQVLYVGAQPLDATGAFHITGYTSLNDFTLHNAGGVRNFFWWAIGV